MIKAVQINPACQDPLLDDYVFDDISVFGNRHLNEHMHPIVEKVRDVVSSGGLSRELNEVGLWRCAYSTATEAIYDILPPEKANGAKYSTREIHAIKTIVENEYMDENDTIIALLSIVTGTEFECKCIRGCCQDDWNYAYYRKADFPNGIEWFEVEYFNTGTEWLVDDEVSVYCHGWRDEDIAAEIAENYGCNVSELRLEYFDGTTWAA